MTKFFNKKVRIEDNGLTSKGRVIADNKIADGITEKNETEESWDGPRSFSCVSHALQPQLFTLCVG